MRELTLEVDDFGKPLLHSKLNSVVMQIYSILLNHEDRAYPNQAIGIGFMDYVGTVITDDSLQEIATDLLKVIDSLIVGTTIQDVGVDVARDSDDINTKINVSISFSYIDSGNVYDGEATYQFTNYDGKTTSHIFV